MSVLTRNLMKSIGFIEDKIRTDKLSIDFGNFVLSAIFCYDLYGQEVVLLTGVMSTPRRIAQVQDEMPWELESYEQGVAWITWCLDKRARDRIFKPTRPMDWIAEGRQNFHLLPWEKDRIEYANRPNCIVQRDWARFVLRKLSEQVACLDDETSVSFQFDGEVLSVRCGDAIFVMPGHGNKWTCKYLLKANVLRHPIQRLMSDMIGFSFWKSKFTIGRYRYENVDVVEV